MKKILTILLALSMLFALVSCGEKSVVTDEKDKEEIVQTGTGEEVLENEETKEDEKEVADENDKGDEKPEAKPEAKPEEKPEAKPSAKPEEKPETTPSAKPEAKPEEKPEETAKTLGTTLLADFKSKANSMGAEELANALLANPAIQFMGGAMAVEEGLLSGFDNAEITGFKSGAVFMPMIGSIPFIGYVFELENASDVPGFIKKLEDNANLRWNICVTADEMVTGSVGNKVFFVMCPTSLEE